MKKIKNLTLALSALLLATQSCELVDPTEVINPNITQETQVGVPNSTILYLNGLERQLAITYNNHVDITELGSDNYVNTETFYNQLFDQLDLQFQDADINNAQFTIADLREGAAFGIETLHPADPAATPEQLAELHFFRGWAFLLGGELFETLPGEANGTPVASEVHLQNAVSDFLVAEGIDDTSISYKLALARAYYRLGDRDNAVAKANEAIQLNEAAGSNFVRFVVYDAVNGPASTIQNALYDRGNFDDYQPLPRLDFLDPKHYQISGAEDSNTALQKIEEAFLILAEASLAQGNVNEARTTLTDLIAVVDSRASSIVDETVEQRRANVPDDEARPDTSAVVVRASASDPFRAGLVINRVVDASIPTLSGTSVTADMLANATTEDEMLELVYLMRQEIFIAEGRRFTDLGLRMPVSEVEQLSNPNVTDADVTVTIPAFLPAAEMDAFEYDTVTLEATITHNLNAILVQNKASDLVLPFH
jgi:tetratricopeptide (TPR) repeat protein